MMQMTATLGLGDLGHLATCHLAPAELASKTGRGGEEHLNVSIFVPINASDYTGKR